MEKQWFWCKLTLGTSLEVLQSCCCSFDLGAGGGGLRLGPRGGGLGLGTGQIELEAQ